MKYLFLGLIRLWNIFDICLKNPAHLYIYKRSRKNYSPRLKPKLEQEVTAVLEDLGPEAVKQSEERSAAFLYSNRESDGAAAERTQSTDTVSHMDLRPAVECLELGGIKSLENGQRGGWHGWNGKPEDAHSVKSLYDLSNNVHPFIKRKQNAKARKISAIIEE